MGRPRGIVKYLLYRLMMAVLAVLPRHLCYWVARRIARLNYCFDRRGREAVKANLRIVLGPDADERRVRHEALWTFRLFGMFLVDFLGIRRFGQRILREQVNVTGEEEFDRIVRERGAVAVSAHFGSWQMGPAWSAHRGQKTLSVILQPPEDLVDRLFTRLRQQHKQAFVDLEDAMRRCVRTLRDDRSTIIIVAGDRPLGEKGVEVEMFGHKVYFAQGPARIALRTGAALYPVFVLRCAGDSYLVEYGRPIEPPERGSARKKAHAMTRAYAEQLERVIRSHPSQWFLFYEVFDPPDGLPPDPVRVAYERMRSSGPAASPVEDAEAPALAPAVPSEPSAKKAR